MGENSKEVLNLEKMDYQFKDRHKKEQNGKKKYNNVRSKILLTRAAFVMIPAIILFMIFLFIQEKGEAEMVTNQSAALGVINMAGNDTAIGVEISNRNDGKVLYQSEKLWPGTILQLQELAEPIKDLEKVTLKITMYDAQGVNQGVFETEVKFNENSKAEKKDE